jgi:hypothetical protein
LLRNIKVTILLFSLFLGLTLDLWSQDKDQETVPLSDSIGTVIDSLEKQTYHLFPDIENFQKGQIIQLSPSKFRLDYGYQDLSGTHFVSRKISKEAFELTKLHVRLTEDYHKLSKSESINQKVEADLLYRLSLKYASEARYDFASRLISDLVESYPETPQAVEAKRLQPHILRLLRTKKALIYGGSLIDQSGRTELLIFSGYYGLWLGIATPIWLEADSPEAFGLGLLLGGPLSLAAAYSLTKDASISEGKATIISLGGHLGTWQGIGWGIVADKEGSSVVGLGEICGLTGIGAATYLANQIDFSEGHAALTSSGLQWGAWFGLVLGEIADHDGDEVLRDMLLGSDIAILSTGFLTKDVKMSQARVRLINLGGVLGTVAGFGVDLLTQVDEASTAFAIAGTGSVAGLVVATNITRNYDKGKDLSQSSLEFPIFSLVQNPHNEKEIIPTIGFQVNF